MTDFVNLKIKPTQSFRCVYRDRVCVHIFIRIITHTCIRIYVCTVFLKKIKNKPFFIHFPLCFFTSELKPIRVKAAG
jgi:hypothetical protein